MLVSLAYHCLVLFVYCREAPLYSLNAFWCNNQIILELMYLSNFLNFFFYFLDRIIFFIFQTDHTRALYSRLCNDSF